jgi:hypothetical protein
MDQSLTAGPDATLDELAGLLRESHRRAPKADQDPAGPNIADFLPLWARMMWRSFGFLARGAAFRAAISGRIPGIGPLYRWFMTQQYLAPKQSTTFLAFAERLTKGNIAGEDTAQVEKLLVRAFLRDLRRAYSRLPWRLRGWRRTAYPLVTIDGKADATDVRYRFMRLLGDVGNETGRFNPLLVVYSAERPSAETAEPSGPDDAYESWAEALPKARRKRDPFAWVLPLSPPEDVAAGAGVPRITAPKPPSSRGPSS